MVTALWIVTNQYLGEGFEGVIVEAGDEAAALAAAKAALVAHWTNDDDRGRDERAEHLAAYADDKHRWLIERIELPYIGSFG
jgi:hypothetical protein